MQMVILRKTDKVYIVIIIYLMYVNSDDLNFKNSTENFKNREKDIKSNSNLE